MEKKLLFGDSFLDENNQIQRRVSEINNPNSSFADLNIHFHKYNTPNAMLSIAPSNFAYFRLGAEAGSACDTLGSVTTGNQPQEMERGMLVFPNPNAGLLTVQFNQVRGIVHYQLLSALGQVVNRWNSNETNQQLNLMEMGLNSGLYILHAQSEDGKMHHQKFIYQR
jgi:hypothetical protein